MTRGGWQEGLKRKIWGCGQCPHFAPRTGWYGGRTGPDSACFRGFPVFARAGMQFESHLGHNVFPRQRRICFDVLTYLDFRRSDGLIRGCGLAAATAYSGVWGGGFKALTGGPSACCDMVLVLPRSGLLGWAVVGLHLFMVPAGWLQHDLTRPCSGGTEKGTSGCRGKLRGSICPVKEGVYSVHT